MKPRVLVLDDEARIRDLVTETLEQEGYEVVSVSTMSEVESARRAQKFDLYVLDVVVPDGNGLWLARELSRDSDAGILLLTGQSDETDRVVGLEIGADDYIVKPFRPREFRARVNAVYRRISRGGPRGRTPAGEPLPREQDSMRFHELELCPDARTLRRADGAEIGLTTLEFDVLLVFVRHANRVLSRDQIMDAVKGQDWSAYDRAIDGLVSRIRSKLYPDGSGVRRIKTIRNVGYMLSTTEDQVPGGSE